MLSKITHIYAWDLWWVLLVAAILVVVWALVTHFLRPRRVFWGICLVMLGVSLVGILKFTVWGRVPGDSSIFVWTSEAGHEEFWREMVMNVFLYVPFGLFASSVIREIGLRAGKGRATLSRNALIVCAVVGLLLSVGVETWQYFACTGTAQGTDVLCNTLGAAVGSLSLFVSDALDASARSHCQGDSPVR